MRAPTSGIPREEIRVPSVRRLSMPERVAKAIAGITLAPICWGLAHWWSVPGLDYQRRCASLGLRLLMSRSRRESLRSAFDLLFRPMDSTRYFELSFVWEVLHPLQEGMRHLDVSSPRLVTLMLLAHNEMHKCVMINPDASDLDQSRQLASLLEVSDRCVFHTWTVSEARFAPEGFDVVTCVSVLEHVLDDRGAVSAMWESLSRGGRLLLTVPTKARASEQWIDMDAYGLQMPDERGFTFWQRFYDEASLEERVFSITGRPRRMAVYGEKRRGTLARNFQRKRGDPLYPYWTEPLFMGREFAFWPSASSLPGEGVVAMEFIKT